MTKPISKKAIFPKFFLVLTLIILILVAIALGRQVYRKYQIEKEVSFLDRQILEIKQDNLRLSELLSYFQKDSFLELEARAELNFKKPEEKVIILTPSEEVSITEGESREEKEMSNLEKWWKYFFKN